MACAGPRSPIEGLSGGASGGRAGVREPFRSAIRQHLKGHTQGLEDLAIEMLACGLSVRDIEDAFKDENGRLLLSKTAVSQLGERLWEDYQAFAQRDLSEYEITYLFVDGIAERLRPGAKREPVLAAGGFTIEGRRVLLHMMAGSKEDAETVTAFFEDMKRRGLNDPLLVTSDGAPGIIKAIEVCLPRAARQRCLAHRMRNLAAKLPEDVWPEFKLRAQAAYQAPSRAIAHGAPLSVSGFSRMAERTAVAADLGIKVNAHMPRYACGKIRRPARQRLVGLWFPLKTFLK